MATNPTMNRHGIKPLVSKQCMMRDNAEAIACGNCHALFAIDGIKLEQMVSCPMCGRSYTFKGQIHDELLFEVE